MTASKSALFKVMLAEFDDETVAGVRAEYPGISDAAADMLHYCGSELGASSESATRYCHVHNGDASLVIKVETKGRLADPWANRREAKAWNAVKGHAELAKWFAPVRWVSPCGYVMTQTRAETKASGMMPDDFPDTVPGIFALLADMHEHNFGKIGNQVVCLDYTDENFARMVSHKRAVDDAVVDFEDGAGLMFFLV